MAEKNTALWVVVAIVVIVIGMSQGWFAGLGGNAAPAGNAGTNNIVTSSTTLSLSAYDAQASGTSVGVASTVGVDGQPLASGVTSVSQGSKLVALLTNSTAYHTALFTGTVPATTNMIKSVPLNKNASLTIAVYNNAKAAMSNGVGATNQSVTTGSAPTMELDLTGTSLASTQDMICILEGSDTSKINKLELNGFSASFIGTSKPSSYTLAGGSSGVWVYKVPAITDASLRVGSIYAESKQGQDMSGKYFILTCKTSEYFNDANANANTVNAYAQKVAEPNIYYGIEDSQGTAKSMASYTFTGYFE